MGPGSAGSSAVTARRNWERPQRLLASIDRESLRVVGAAGPEVASSLVSLPQLPIAVFERSAQYVKGRVRLAERDADRLRTARASHHR